MKMLVAAAALLLCSYAFVDTGAVAAQWNVRHAREVDGTGAGIDLCYLAELGTPALLPALVKLGELAVAAEMFLRQRKLTVSRADGHPKRLFQAIDHCVGNVELGRMGHWADWYSRVLGFSRYISFDDKDISTEYTALMSKVMSNGDGRIKFPINEPAEGKGGKSQIQEYLAAYHGEGIQHIALSTEDIYATVRQLRANGVDFMVTPGTYYDKVDTRVAGHGEPTDVLRELSILIDGAPGDDGILLQIFTNTVIGPIFFEIIQRKGNQGFGEGNFKALFESIEEDQIKRGVISEE